MLRNKEFGYMQISMFIDMYIHMYVWDHNRQSYQVKLCIVIILHKKKVSDTPKSTRLKQTTRTKCDSIVYMRTYVPVDFHPQLCVCMFTVEMYSLGTNPYVHYTNILCCFIRTYDRICS